MKFFFGLNNKKNLLVFNIGVLTYIQVQVLGTFGVSELIALFLFPFIKPIKISNNFRIRKLIKYLVIAIFGLIISNLYNNVTVEKSLKGVFFLFMFLVDIIFAYWLLKDDYRRVLYYMAGYALSNIIAFLFFPTSALGAMLEMADGNTNELMRVWLVYFIQPSIVFISSIAYFKGYRFLSLLSIQTYAFYALFNGSRNIFLIWTIVVIILLILGNISIQNRFYKTAKIKKLLLFLIPLFLISLIGIKSIYESLASDGTLGERAKDKYFKQKYESGDIGLFSSRIEFFVALKAIKENPVFGYGSYPIDNTELKERTYEDFGMNIRGDSRYQSSSNRLSGHSHILNSYVYGGFLGVLFWIYSLRIVILFLKKHLFYDLRMLVFFLLMTFSWIWDYFFSPFAFRLQESVFLITIILTIKSSESSIKIK